jgi:hypothetical protein
LADHRKEPETGEPDLLKGSINSGIWLSVLIAIVLAKTGHSGWCWGYSVGAGISMLSLFGLAVMVPMVSFPGAPRATQFLLSLALFLKLPFYLIVLDITINKPGVEAASIFAGVLMAPAAITGKTIKNLILVTLKEAAMRRRIRRGGAVSIRERLRVRFSRTGKPGAATEQG